MGKSTIIRECLAEVIGTFILVFFGVGAVHAAVFTGAQVGLWQVAVVWGIGVALAIYAVGAVSGAHLNPAITLAFASFRQFPFRKVLPYWAAQLLGAFLGAAVLYALFQPWIAHFELVKGITRGLPGSELSAMCYGEYFPNPALGSGIILPVWLAMLAEGAGTALLAFAVFAVTDPRNPSRPDRALAAPIIGLTVSIIISVLAPLTQAGLNPARDFGPRLFAYLAGWGSIAIPGPHGGAFTVYILAPILGALVGAAAYQYLVHPVLPPVIKSPVERSTSDKGACIVPRPTLILVGGFLGAGKTTLLRQAAQRLAARGLRVGLITNDQAPQLVDTGLLQGAGFPVAEIAGGCFCCRFSELTDSADRLIAEQRPDVILGEPVGSCTDISATVLQPLKDLFAAKYRLAPFTVLVDPRRLEEALDPRLPSPLHASARYILRKQLEEADAIAINKADLLEYGELAELRHRLDDRFPATPAFSLSALAGDGVEAWLDYALREAPAGQRIVEVDYDTYAEGEAVLGWLNATVRLTAQHPADWAAFAQSLLTSLHGEFQRECAEVAHVKLLLETADGRCVANLTSTGSTPSLRNALPACGREATLTLNARVEMPPDALRALVDDSLYVVAERVGVQFTVVDCQSLSPGYPHPVHRYQVVVEG